MSSPTEYKQQLQSKRILVTGGIGYIGSHTVLELLNNDAYVVIIDNLSNANYECLLRLQKISGKNIEFYPIDIRHREALAEFLDNQAKFDACIHFAGLKAVGESVFLPMKYYDNNVMGTLNLLNELDRVGCGAFVFSSSATVYGLAEKNPIPETAPLSTTNPYGQTKLVIEGILHDMATRLPIPAGSTMSKSPDTKWKVVILRYFNPIGAHKSGLIGEDPNGIPNNLLPYATQVAIGRRESLSIFGNDYPTQDGTGVRDYIHVVDLARGHCAALAHGIFGNAFSTTIEAVNLGTGIGNSVLDVVHAVEKSSGKKLAYEFKPRRQGDVAACYSDPSKAASLFKWKAEFTLEKAVADSWKWQSQNPNGFKSA